MTRKRRLWKLAGREVVLGEKTLMAGVIELGRTADPDRVFAQALLVQEQGAGLIHLAGDLRAAGEEEELRALVPALKRLQGKVGAPVIVSTGRAAVAERALQLGAEIVYDPWSLSLDPELGRLVSRLRAGLVLAHMRGSPEVWAKQPPVPDVMVRVRRDLEAAVLRARRVGIEPSQLGIDPGLGFGKRREENATILARLPEFAGMHLPVMVTMPSWPQPLSPGASAAHVTAAVLGGASVVGVREVELSKLVVEASDGILEAQQAGGEE